MNRTELRALVTMCAGVATGLCAPAVAMAQQLPAQPEKAKSASVRLQMVATERTGSVSARSGAADNFAPGETHTFWGWVMDRPNVPNTSKCPTGSAAGNFTEPPWKGFGNDIPLQAWTVQVQLVEARVDSVVLTVRLAHMHLRDDDLRGLPVRGTSDVEQRTLTLAVQQPYVLGYVDGSQTSLCDWANVMVQLSAEPNPVPNALAALAYDLWFVREDGRGNRATNAEQGLVPQGDLAHVSFRPRVWPIPRPYLWPIPGSSCEVQVEMSVDFRGRIREDGLIDLSVEPQRTFKLVLPDRVATPSIRASPGTGKKTLTVKPNEPVELVLPAPVERFSNAQCGAVQGTIDLNTLFPGQRTSLIFKVRKEP